MILAIGDSFTYGEELLNREQTAWPFLLGQMFGHDVNNLGMPGGSNDRMFRLAIEETARQHSDLVIVAWTDVARMEFNDSGGSYITVLPSQNVTKPHELWRKDLFKYAYNDKAAHFNWYIKVLALQEYFKSIGQKYLYVTVGEILDYADHYEYYQHVLDKIDTTYATTWPKDGFLTWQGDCPKGPRHHPLELGHQRIATEIAKYIKDLNLL